ncbi:MAG: hypothetical protein M1376_04645 [Planctomycetes bacterium]|nr:hypothetical protein [Planctomycetota bacterium]
MTALGGGSIAFASVQRIPLTLHLGVKLILATAISIGPCLGVGISQDGDIGKAILGPLRGPLHQPILVPIAAGRRHGIRIDQRVHVHLPFKYGTLSNPCASGRAHVQRTL